MKWESKRSLRRRGAVEEMEAEALAKEDQDGGDATKKLFVPDTFR